MLPAANRPSWAFEIKYLLPARRAAAAAAWLDALCLRDPQYPEGHVRTLYLDTPGLKFLGEKIEGDFLKTKIRLRWYAPSWCAPAAGSVWLEIKRRESMRRAKTRVQFHASAAAIERSGPSGVDAGRVVDIVRGHGVHVPGWLRPTLALSYSRSRWVEPGTGARIALDRAIQPTWIEGRGNRPAGSFLELRTAVVEFKGNEPQAPPLLRGIARFGSRKVSFSKYFSCYARMVSGGQPDSGGDI